MQQNVLIHGLEILRWMKPTKLAVWGSLLCFPVTRQMNLQHAAHMVSNMLWEQSSLDCEVAPPIAITYCKFVLSKSLQVIPTITITLPPRALKCGSEKQAIKADTLMQKVLKQFLVVVKNWPQRKSRPQWGFKNRFLPEPLSRASLWTPILPVLQTEFLVSIQGGKLS